MSNTWNKRKNLLSSSCHVTSWLEYLYLAFVTSWCSFIDCLDWFLKNENIGEIFWLYQVLHNKSMITLQTIFCHSLKYGIRKYNLHTCMITSHHLNKKQHCKLFLATHTNVIKVVALYLCKGKEWFQYLGKLYICDVK